MSAGNPVLSSPETPPSQHGSPVSNPFPGLRPFGASEASLFFGRREHVEALLAKLQRQRLLAVVGTSGSGKSSLVLAGILPRLDRGYRTATGTSWRIVAMRPGSAPIAHLAAALQSARERDDDQAYDGLTSAHDERTSGTRLEGSDAALERDLLRIELERSSNGLLEAVRSLGLGRGENLLLVVDQFEELFRFHHLTQGQARDVAAAFVKLLLRASQQIQLPIYVMLTLRSDFLGECVEFPGLAEAISEGQYLVPLLNRDQRAEVIRGPVGVAGASISAGLVQRLLNDAGDMTDQLPVLQHAMMRTFELAQADVEAGASVRIELSHYEASGEMTGALSRHADQAYAEVGRKLGVLGQRVAERLFRCLTDGNEHGGGVRRPCKVSEVLAAAGCDLPTLTTVVAAFIDQRRGFLVQQPAGALTSDTTLDISHESLMRNWKSLRKWSTEELALGRQLRALADAEREYSAKTRSLLRDPELSLGLKWRREQRLTDADAQRYGVTLKAVNAFLDESAAAARRRSITLWVALCAAFLGLSLLAVQLHQSRRLAQQSAAEATAARVKAEASEAEAKRALAAAKMATLVRLARDTESEPGRAAAYLRETGYAAGERGAAWHALAASVAQRVLAWKLEGHSGDLLSASFSSDGARIVTAAEDGTARVWDTDSGRLLAKLADSVEVVRSASFSLDGERVVTVSDEPIVRIWDAGSGRLTTRLTGHAQAITSARFSSDGSRVVTSSWDKTARVWDSVAGSEIAMFQGHRGEIYSASFSRDGQRVVTASADLTARIWEVRSKLFVALEGHTGLVHTAEFSPDGNRVVTASEDKTARLWDATSGKLVHELVGHTGPLASATFSADGRWIVTASDDKTARVWDGHTGELAATLEGHGDRVDAASFGGSDGRVVTASWDGTARVWSGATGKPLAVLTALANRKGVVHSALLSADGQRIVTAAEDKVAWVWDGRTPERDGHSAHVNMTSFSPDGARVVTASSDGTARLWDSSTGKTVATLTGHTAPVQIALFSDDGHQIFTASSDNTARIWSRATGKPVAVLDGHSGGINGISYSPDGTRLVTGSWDKKALVWDSGSGRQVARLEGHLAGVGDVSFASDGNRIVTASWDGTAKIWESIPRGRCLYTLKSSRGPMHSAAFDRAGDRVVTTSDDGSARIWDARTGALLHTLAGHAAALRTAQFSADGRSVVTVSEDNTARIWDVNTGALQRVLAGHTGPVNSVSFSADQRLLVTTSADKTARVWERESGELVSVLEGHLGSVHGAAFSADGSRIFTTSADGSGGIWQTNGDALRFLGDGGKARRAQLRQHDGHAVAEVWSETSRRWLDARTVFWQELGLCLSQEERMETLAESTTQAESAHRRCRDTVAACRNASVEDCERAIARQ